MSDTAIQIVMIGVWLGLLIFFLAIELETAQLVSIWFAGGSLVALLVAAFNVPIPFQILTFAIVSVVCLLIIKIFFPQLGLRHSKGDIDTAANKNIVGKELVVLKKAEQDNPGEGKVNGVLWSLITPEGEVVYPGEKVVVVEICGNRLLVQAKQKGGINL